MEKKCKIHGCDFQIRVLAYGKTQKFCPKCLEEERRVLVEAINVNLPKHMAMKEFWKRRR